MKTPLAWISLYTPLAPLLDTHSLKSLAHEYSIHTAEIDGIEDHFLDRVVIGKVVSCEKHPESKKLSIVEVQISADERTTILTGASNIVDATYVPVALVGAVLPGDFSIGERMMAGMMSRGMICGADEIGISTEHSGGIMILEEIWDEKRLESMIGESFFDLTLPFVGIGWKIYEYPLRDTTFEIDNKFITNRPDLFAVYGNAREWGAVFDLEFSEYPTFEISDVIQLKEKVSTSKKNYPVKIESDRVLAYQAIEMRNIAVWKSPWGISLMMERAGLAPKMDLVDITNLIATEFGQPLHVFDADLISGGITVRLARVGETIIALNNITYTLTTEDLIIADANGPIAIAGVIGGLESAVSSTTTSVVWESGCFDPVSVRLTAQRHGIRTDASTRYEKSLDPLLTLRVIPRIDEYLSFLGKSTPVSSESLYLDESRVNRVTLDISYAFLSTKIGVDIDEKSIQKILTSLGFTWIEKSGGLIVTVPSYRATKDISIQEDIAEEIGRVYGYDRVPLTPLSSVFRIARRSSEITLRDRSLEFWSEHGWHEVYNYSFSSSTLDRRIGMDDMGSAIAIQNSFNTDYTHMRRSLATRLLENIKNNEKLDSKLKLFELAKVYHTSGEMSQEIENMLATQDSRPYSEKKILAWVATWVDIVEIKSDIEIYLTRILGYTPPVYQDHGSVLPHMHPGMSAEYRLDDTVLARYGRIHPMTATAYDISPTTLYWEIEYETLLVASSEQDHVFAPISRYQSIPRELNFVMDDRTVTSDIARSISSLHPWISGIRVDSVYRDEERIGKEKKSVNFAFVLTSHEGTISDEEALKVQTTIIDHMAEKNYTLRS
jgi:phenylalanyl-tRNA synthetase beta chain